MRFINYDGTIIDAEQPIVKASNRGLRYGDGLFETMKQINGSINNWEDHIERLYKGLAMLAFKVPDYITPDFLLEQTNNLCKKNILNTARIRLMFFRGEGNIFDADHTCHFIIEALPLSDGVDLLNTEGYTVGIYEDARKQIDQFSNLKTNNYLAYSMGAIHATNQRWHDSLIMNTNGDICESTIANLFMVKDGAIITPGLDQGCVAGTMRKHLLKTLPSHGFSIVEDKVTIQMIENADELFLTNALQRIKWIARCGNKKYLNTIVNQICDALKS